MLPALAPPGRCRIWLSSPSFASTVVATLIRSLLDTERLAGSNEMFLLINCENYKEIFGDPTMHMKYFEAYLACEYPKLVKDDLKDKVAAQSKSLQASTFPERRHAFKEGFTLPLLKQELEEDTIQGREKITF